MSLLKWLASHLMQMRRLEIFLCSCVLVFLLWFRVSHTFESRSYVTSHKIHLFSAKKMLYWSVLIFMSCSICTMPENLTLTPYVLHLTFINFYLLSPLFPPYSAAVNGEMSEVDEFLIPEGRSIIIYHIFLLVWKDYFKNEVLLLSNWANDQSREPNDRNENLRQAVVPKPDLLRVWIGHFWMATKPGTAKRRNIQCINQLWLFTLILIGAGSACRMPCTQVIVPPSRREDVGRGGSGGYKWCSSEDVPQSR